MLQRLMRGTGSKSEYQVNLQYDDNSGVYFQSHNVFNICKLLAFGKRVLLWAWLHRWYLRMCQLRDCFQSYVGYCNSISNIGSLYVLTIVNREDYQLRQLATQSIGCHIAKHYLYKMDSWLPCQIRGNFDLHAHHLLLSPSRSFIMQSLVIIDGIYSIDRFFNSMIEDSINNTFVVVKAAFSIICTIMAIGLNFLSYYYSIFELSICNSILMVLLLAIVFLRVFKGFNLLIWGSFSLYINIFIFLVHD